MNIVYSWVSTEDKNHDLQYAALKKVGCQHIFIEKATWTYVQRTEVTREKVEEFNQKTLAGL